MASLQLKDILPLLKNLHKNGDGFSARCPSHDDQKNSLAVKEGSDGKVFFKCFAGCTYQEIISALGISLNGGAHKTRIEAIFNYPDECGNVLYQNVRYVGKKFRWRQWDANGREIWNLNGVQRVPYRLPDLLKLSSDSDFIMAEGEKDADRLTEIGLTATNHKNWNPKYNYLLKGKRVIIHQDHDRAGVKIAEKAAQEIYSDARSVKIVDCFANEPLPDKHGKDVSDYLQTHSKDELLELIRATPEWKPDEQSEAAAASNKGKFRVVCLSDVRAEEIVWLWKPFIPVGEFTIIEGIEGLGKSWITCALACTVAAGVALPFSDSVPIPPARVLMLSAEDSLSHTVTPRLISMRANTDRIFALDEVFSLDNPNDLIKFEEVIAEYEPKLVIIDPLFSYTGGKNLNQESDSRPLARKLITIAQKYQCAVVGVRHIGKAKGNGDARAAGLGSVAWRASARSVLLVGKDEETDEKAICQTKNNLAEMAKFSVGFDIVDGEFHWKGKPSVLTKEKMLAQPQDSDKKVEQSEAVEFLRVVLGNGECKSKDVETDAKKLAISSYALRKARLFLGIKPYKKGGNFGGEKDWFIRLPETKDCESVAEGIETSDAQHLQSTQSNKAVYSNSLAEGVETGQNQHLQLIQSTSSNGLVPQTQMPQVCTCGVEGMVAAKCKNCGEVIIPF